MDQLVNVFRLLFF